MFTKDLLLDDGMTRGYKQMCYLVCPIPRSGKLLKNKKVDRK